MTTGTLYCIPVPLAPDLPMSAALTADGAALAAGLDAFVVENARTARAFLKTLPLRVPLQSIAMQPIDAGTDEAALDAMLAPLRAGRDRHQGPGAARLRAAAARQQAGLAGGRPPRSLALPASPRR